MSRGEKIALIGRNGAGKTTLVKSLLRNATGFVDAHDRAFTIDAGSVAWGHEVAVGYFAQDHKDGIPLGVSIIEWLHATEEVFISVKGQWGVFWLEGDTERQIILDCGDAVNVPIGVFRGFRNVGDDPDSLLIALVGGPDPGKVDWHPTVVEEARRTGLSVDDDGNLVIAEPMPNRP